MVDYFALAESGNFSNLLKSNPVGPCGPNNPVGTIFGGLRFFDTGYGITGMFGFHLGSILAFFLILGKPAM
jgi:hypothetical protein